MRFSFIPREKKFFDMFDEIAAILVRAAGKFLELLTVFNDLPARGKDLKQEEDKCDVWVEKIIRALDQTFITPFDREDIHTLATKLDDVMDNIEETAHRFEVFHLERPTPEAIELARIIGECCTHVASALRQLRNINKPEVIQANLLEISKLENQADMIYREVDAALMEKGAIDILGLIKWRELYLWLEESVDACKDVAQVISEIVIKGS